MAHLGNTIVNGALRVLGGEYADSVTLSGPITFSGSTNQTITPNGSGTLTVSGTLNAVGLQKNGTSVATTSDISTLQSNFQAGVDSVYNAIVARGTTPASKSLSDVVTGIGNIQTTHTGTYKPTTRASNCDMGVTHSYRYVNTTAVPNSNSGTQSITANGTTDMGATNDKRYVSVNVPNSNSGTYTPAGNSTYDMGATNSYRYCDGRTAYTAGYNAKKAELTGTYKPTSRATGLDMGANHTYRYVNTTSVPNSNSGTYAVTSNGVKDMGADNTQRYVNVAVPNSNSGTYTPTTKSTFDMGATNDKRYVDTRSVANVNSGTYAVTSNGVKDMGADNAQRYVNVNVPNSNSGTYTPAGNSTYDMGATNSYRYCDGRTAYTAGYNAKRDSLTGTYAPTTRGSKLDMGADHTYRYVNTNGVPNSNSGTYDVTSNGIKDMTAANSYRYVNVSVANSNSGTATYDSNGIKDMGATNSNRYVNINVPNSNSGTYSVTSNGLKDMGATNSQRYVNVNVPNSNSGTVSYTSNGVQDMGATNSYRYVNINVPHPEHTTTYTPTARASKNDMGATHSYRYVDTRSVPNYNSLSAQFDEGSTGATIDLGETNSIRYMNAGNVYTKGYNDYAASLAGTYTYPSREYINFRDMGANHHYRYVDAQPVWDFGVENGLWQNRLTWIGAVVKSWNTNATTCLITTSDISSSINVNNTYLIISACIGDVQYAGFSAFPDYYYCNVIDSWDHKDQIHSGGNWYIGYAVAKVKPTHQLFGVQHYYNTGYNKIAFLAVIQIGG